MLYLRRIGVTLGNRGGCLNRNYVICFELRNLQLSGILARGYPRALLAARSPVARTATRARIAQQS